MTPQVDNINVCVKNIRLVLKIEVQVDANDEYRIIHLIHEKLLTMRGPNNTTVDIGSLLFLKKDDLIIVYCILNKHITKRINSLPELIPFNTNFSLFEVNNYSIRDFMDKLKVDLGEGCKVVAIPK